MGMDVVGIKPESERGEYFRNNVWWWRPLLDYCATVASEIVTDEVAAGCSCNDGNGLDAEGAIKLANILQDEIESGRTKEHQDDYNKWRSELPREHCNICDGTGIRTDDLGVEHGWPTKELDPEVQILTGRTHGSCNSCHGVGTTEAWLAHYPFSVENVQEFALFLKESGGFQVW